MVRKRIANQAHLELCFLKSTLISHLQKVGRQSKNPKAALQCGRFSIL